MAGEPLVTVVGNLVADPELRVSQAGKSWCTFRFANTPRVRDKQSGDWSDGEALWLGCRAYGELAENIVSSFIKGTRVIMQGRLTQRSYTDQQGNQRTSLDFEVEAIGPELRWHVARPVKASEVSQQASAWGSQGGQPQGQPAWGQAAAPQQDQGNPWNNAGQAAQAPQQPAQQPGNPWQGQGQQNAPQQPQGQPQGGFGGGFDDEQPF